MTLNGCGFDGGIAVGYSLCIVNAIGADMAEGLDESEHLTPKETQTWLQEEIAQLSKAMELRTKEATALATAFTKGEISAEEAGEQRWKYTQRWGEALPGVMSMNGMTDEQILATIDEAQDPEFVERLMQKRTQRNDKNQEPGTSR
jgi:hypothetical protein